MTKRTDYAELGKRFLKAKTFIIGSHYSPDGDGIGSTIALGISLERMGKKIVMYNRDKVPWNLKFLPFSDRVVDKISPDWKFDMAVMVDCAQQKRISDEFAAFLGAAETVCIDHHMLDSADSDFLLVDGGASSTGEVILRLMKDLKVVVTEDLAQCIYTTLVVDTGFFRYSNTTEHALALASELVKAGASPWLSAKHLEEEQPASRLKLLALSLQSMKIELGGLYASMDVTAGMLAASGADIEMSDEFASYPRSIAGVEVSALFREVESSLVKVSLRSKDYVDVAHMASIFGGGGHSRAAGFRIRTSMDEAKSRVRKAIEGALRKQ